MNAIILALYGIFLAVMLVVNLLYFFQVFKYRLPGDASLTVLSIHLFLIFLILIGSGVYIGFA